MHDPAVVRAEYADETRLAARKAAHAVPPVDGEIRARRLPSIFVAERP